MKHFLVYLLFLGAVFAVKAQTVSKLTIMKNVKESFPKSENIEISSRCGSYEATFFQNNEPIKACFAQNGSLQMTTYLVEQNDLPREARNDIQTNFSTLTISEILKKKDAQGKVEYTVNFEDRSRLFFDEGGERIQMFSNCQNKNVNK